MSLPARIGRRFTQWRVAQPIGKTPERPIVSFTFDDFPKSAVDIGAQIVEDVGGHATYYACTSFLGQTTPTGPQYELSDIEALKNAGHEIGAHTHTHFDCSLADVKTSHSDIELNLRRLEDIGVTDIQSFAYPYGETRYALKCVIRDRFSTARGILAGRNGAQSDRMQLRALEVVGAEWTVERAKRALRSAEKSPAWIVIFTHDVAPNPSKFGTKPQALKDLAQMAKDIGADITTMRDAASKMGLNHHA